MFLYSIQCFTCCFGAAGKELSLIRTEQRPHVDFMILFGGKPHSWLQYLGNLSLISDLISKPPV